MPAVAELEFSRPPNTTSMNIPTSRLRRNNTHRLIPSKYSAGDESVLTRIADDAAHLADIFAFDDATNDRLLAENRQHEGIGVRELAFGFRYASIVNASFVHAHPLGGRFNGPHRGAWYAGFELSTSQAEVTFHKTLQLAEIRIRGCRHLRRLPGRLQRRVPRSAESARLQSLSRSEQLHGVAASCRESVGERIIRRRLSQRPEARRNLHLLLQTRACDKRPQGSDIRVSLGRPTGAEDQEALELELAAPGSAFFCCSAFLLTPLRI